MLAMPSTPVKLDVIVVNQQAFRKWWSETHPKMTEEQVDKILSKRKACNQHLSKRGQAFTDYLDGSKEKFLSWCSKNDVKYRVLPGKVEAII